MIRPRYQNHGKPEPSIFSAFNWCLGHIPLIRFDFHLTYSEYSVIALLKDDFLGGPTQKGYL